MFKKFVRYIFVGVVNSAFAYSMFVLFMYLGIHYRFSVLLSLLAGVLFNFKTIGGIVFKGSDNKSIFRFALSYIVIFVISVVGLDILKRCGINMYIGGILLMPLSAVVSFTMFNLFVFNKKRPSEHETKSVKSTFN